MNCELFLFWLLPLSILLHSYLFVNIFFLDVIAHFLVSKNDKNHKHFLLTSRYHSSIITNSTE